MIMCICVLLSANLLSLVVSSSSCRSDVVLRLSSFLEFLWFNGPSVISRTRGEPDGGK